jgi:acetyl-CoA hydrolase
MLRCKSSNKLFAGPVVIAKGRGLATTDQSSLYAEFVRRIRRKELHSKITTAEAILPEFKNGMNMGWSGFTAVGCPKKVPIVLANHVEANNLQGKMKFNLFVGAR